VRRFVGEKVPLLKAVRFSKLINVLRELKDLNEYSGNFVFFPEPPLELVPLISGGVIRRKGAPVQTANEIFPSVHFSSSSIKLMTEIYMLEDVLVTMNASIHYSVRSHKGSHMMLSTGETLVLESIIRFATSMSIALKPVTQSFLTCYHFPVVTYDF